MFHRMVSVSVVCLMLAFSGWENQMPIPDEDESQGAMDQLQDLDTDPWFFQLPEFLACCHGYGDDSACRWGIFRLATCSGNDAEPVPKAGLPSEKRYGLFDLLMIIKMTIDEAPISNTAWLFISWAPFLFSFFRRRLTKGWTRRMFRRITSCDHILGVNSDTRLKEAVSCEPGNQEQLLFDRHREEKEIMARTIEYLQRKKRNGQKQTRHNEPRVASPTLVPPECVHREPLVHPGTVRDPSLQETGSSPNDEDFYLDFNFNQSDFIEPDLEWD